MLAVADALALILANTDRLPGEACPAGPLLLGRVLAEDVVSDIDSPPFAKSMVDGYALRHQDLGPQGATLRIVEEIFAGQVPRKMLREGEAAGIMTGAPIPAGADAVVMHEKTELSADSSQVRIGGPATAGQNILPQGQEMGRGEQVLPVGTMLRPEELGLLAAVGRTTLRVYRQPTAALLSTGDELVEPAHRPGPGQIRNSNASMLLGQIVRAGCRGEYLGIARDTPGELRPRLLEGLRHDVLIVSGGVSAGKADLAPGLLQEAGVEAIFHKVAIKPGKPLFFGRKSRTLVFGLPGNPVSGFVGFEVFIRPALRKMMGWSRSASETAVAQLAKEFRYKSDRTLYHPARLHVQGDVLQGGSGNLTAEPLDWRGSADLLTVCRAQGLIILPPGEQTLAAGAKVEVLVTGV
jgi:molybdopterin molybdotransferase